MCNNGVLTNKQHNSHDLIAHIFKFSVDMKLKSNNIKKSRGDHKGALWSL